MAAKSSEDVLVIRIPRRDYLGVSEERKKLARAAREAEEMPTRDHALWAGVDLRTGQAWMGHTDLASTMRYLRPRRDAAMREKVEAIWA